MDQPEGVGVPFQTSPAVTPFGSTSRSLSSCLGNGRELPRGSVRCRCLGLAQLVSRASDPVLPVLAGAVQAGRWFHCDGWEAMWIVASSRVCRTEGAASAGTDRRIAGLLRPLETVHLAFEDYAPDTLSRVWDRRRRHGGEGVSIRRDDRVHFYSTNPLPGRGSSRFWMDTDVNSALLLIARHSLRLPGLGGGERTGPFGWSDDGGCPMKDPRIVPTLVTAGSARERLMSSTAPCRAARRAEDRYGVPVPSLTSRTWRWKPPTQVPGDWWFARLSQELQR